jgi:hypothetical protein
MRAQSCDSSRSIFLVKNLSTLPCSPDCVGVESRSGPSKVKEFVPTFSSFPTTDVIFLSPSTRSPRSLGTIPVANLNLRPALDQKPSWPARSGRTLEQTLSLVGCTRQPDRQGSNDFSSPHRMNAVRFPGMRTNEAAARGSMSVAGFYSMIASTCFVVACLPSFYAALLRIAEGRNAPASQKLASAR